MLGKKLRLKTYGGFALLTLAALIYTGCGPYRTNYQRGGFAMSRGPAPSWNTVANSSSPSGSANQWIAPQRQAQTWTCPMHPEVKQAQPGKCPTCHMNLVKAE